MLRNLLTKVVGDPNEKELKRIQPLVAEINALEPEFQRMSDEELAAQTVQFRQRIREETAELRRELERLQLAREKAEDPDELENLKRAMEEADRELREAETDILNEILPRAFAAVREASVRTLGLRHFDVQLMGGIVLHQGKIAEMKTGEGKTLVATLPLYLNALTGRGVHLVTPNDYLSKFGVQWMGPIYHLLGVSVAVIQSGAGNPDQASFLYDPDYPSEDDRYRNLRPITRREAYQADVVYGTNNEFGFDYLRDNMAVDLSQIVQRELNYAIVDEIDNILIDEARTPLIISGPAQESSDLYRRFAQIVPRLRAEEDYKVDEKDRIVTLTEEGLRKVERMLGIPDHKSLYDPEYAEMAPYLDNALRAQVLYKRDRDYVVQNNEVIIVDEFTGRLMFGRRYSEGLHQAIEAKEGVPIRRENLTLATITFQNFFRMYRKLAGMTGTAATEREEFARIYNLDVVVIPTNVPVRRVDYPDVIYKTQRAKFNAIIEEVVKAHERGQPVLLGTSAIETSEYLSNLLKKKGIEHNVLNAKHHEREAVIIAQAGRPGAVTIATNMAGRGVDILLGGNPENLAREELRKANFDLNTIREAEWNEAVDMLRKGQDPTVRFGDTWAKVLAEQWRRTKADGDKVRAVGGLYVIGSERHEARRIDNQLRGRAGRQGDPGQSRFFLSLEDDLMRRFGGQTLANLMERLGVEEDMPIEAGVVSRAIEQAQTRVEGYNFDLRKHVLEYDDVVNKQRNVIYEQRRRILSEANLRPTILAMVHKRIANLVQTFTDAKYDEDWDLDALHSAIVRIMPLPVEETSKAWRGLSREQLTARLQALAEEAYDRKEKRLGSETMRQIERLLMLQSIDHRWVRHLTDLDILREGIGLQAVAQQDPLVAYKREAFAMFAELLEAIEEDVVSRIYLVELVQQPVRRPMRAVHAPVDGGRQAAPAPQRSAGPQLGRNDPCWCGSGKKYKDCHLRSDRSGQTAGQPTAAQSAPARAPVAGGQKAPTPAAVASGAKASAGKASGSKGPTKTKKRR
ncbi:MAG: preprotein translocase subunit SecA [Anaerolineae bacterium]|nr:preprotein translocase subunit SecA [Caldilineales bacterium]MDW8269253.1 preprotein translocase subunit SecA [Anaerolineae bacterium]